MSRWWPGGSVYTNIPVDILSLVEFTVLITLAMIQQEGQGRGSNVKLMNLIQIL